MPGTRTPPPSLYLHAFGKHRYAVTLKNTVETKICQAAKTDASICQAAKTDASMYKKIFTS